MPGGKVKNLFFVDHKQVIFSWPYWKVHKSKQLINNLYIGSFGNSNA